MCNSFLGPLLGFRDFITGGNGTPTSTASWRSRAWNVFLYISIRISFGSSGERRNMDIVVIWVRSRVYGEDF